MSAIFDPDHFFDKIYCISIDARSDRRRTAKEQFEKLGILSRVEFVLVKKHPDNQEQGIFQSHQECLRRGLRAGAQHILIFEDDILIKKFQTQSVVGATTFLQNTPEWNGFFLGAITSSSTKTEAKSVTRIKYRCLAHAYALNCHFAKQIVQESWNGIPFDDLLRKYCKNYYALSPMIAFQSTVSSDNQTFFLDRMRRIFGGLPFIQRINELFQRHKLPVVLVHILVLMASILLLIKR